MSFTIILVGCGNTKKLECKKVYDKYNQTVLYLLEYTKYGVLKLVTYSILISDYINDELTVS